jgi:hypothetical protein
MGYSSLSLEQHAIPVSSTGVRVISQMGDATLVEQAQASPAAVARHGGTTMPNQDRGFIDYDFHRGVAAQMRAERMNKTLAKGLTVTLPSRRTLRNLGLAFVLATGAFWTVMLKDPPKTIAADPSASTNAFSPLDLKIPLDLPSGDYATH